ncbi:MAG TPA: ABC transporter permease [Thermoanaerobaculia bacterium]|nr:ABC transporter permease [Thermoanaerobaculia bacterium]
MAKEIGRSVSLAVRRLSQSPSLTLAVVFTLALGFGANITIFSLVDAVLFRPLPLPDADRLVRIIPRDPKIPELNVSSYPVYNDYREQAHSFSALAAFSDVRYVNVARGGERPERLEAMLVTGSFFSVLEARPLVGALLSPADDAAGAPAGAVLSESLWRRSFGADPRIVGGTVLINQHPFAVLGVVPDSFVGPVLEARPDLWVPVSKVDETAPTLTVFKPLERRGFPWLYLVARLRPEVTVAQAGAEIETIGRRRAAQQAEEQKDPVAQVVPASAAAFDPDRRDALTRMSWILLGVVTAVLLIACAVVSGLLLVRLERRQKETAMQVALGISRRRLCAELLVESLLLSALGAVAGLGLSSVGRRLLLTQIPADMPVAIKAASSLADLRVLAFTAVACVMVGLVFGLAPALRAMRTAPGAVLKGPGAGASRWGLALRNAFVVVQVALSTVLLIAAGLLLRTLGKASAIEPGFNPDGAVTASFDLAQQGYDEAAGARFAQQLFDRLQQSPGFHSVALAQSVPVGPLAMGLSFQVAGYSPPDGQPLVADIDAVTPGYFKTLGIPLLRGRDFTSQDTAASQPVVIISDTMARRFWPGKDPLGERLGDVAPDGALIVGVVADVKAKSLREPPGLMFYLPIAQFYSPRLSVVVRAPGDLRLIQRQLADVVASLDRNLPLYNLQTLSQRLSKALARERTVAGLFSAFGLLALVLAVGGLYSVISHATELRTREFGIRMAMGSDAGGVRRLVLRQGLVIALAGLFLGLLAALGLTSWLSSLLLEVNATDPATFAAIPVLLILAALLACLVPAFRATRVDPMLALRRE